MAKGKLSPNQEMKTHTTDLKENNPAKPITEPLVEVIVDATATSAPHLRRSSQVSWSLKCFQYFELLDKYHTNIMNIVHVSL